MGVFPRRIFSAAFFFFGENGKWFLLWLHSIFMEKVLKCSEGIFKIAFFTLRTKQILLENVWVFFERFREFFSIWYLLKYLMRLLEQFSKGRFPLWKWKRLWMPRVANRIPKFSVTWVESEKSFRKEFLLPKQKSININLP